MQQIMSITADTAIRPRPRQIIFVERCHAALIEHGNTIGVATVGFGKTIALSLLCARYQRSVVIQHRVELLDQNRSKFQRVAPDAHTSTFAADYKRWARDGHTFAMMQTLVGCLDQMHPVDLLVIDEAHHVEAASYLAIIERARELNPNVHVLGATATPERGDGKSLRSIFTNVADVVSLTEMIHAGFLVKPITYIVEIGMEEEIRKLKKGKDEFNMNAAAELMNVELVTEKVVEKWMELAADRRTIGFATNVAHSIRMMEAFRSAGVSAEHVDGKTPKGLRKAIWRRLRTGDTQMVWNCGVATEGFDEPSIGCVILDRPSMHRSTMIQMIGRGLRTISEPEKYPGIIKTDCIILDFGASLSTHGSLEIEGDIDGTNGKKGEAPMKDCPTCETSIPAGCRVCPICGHGFLSSRGDGKTLVGDFVMTEVDLLNVSPYRWESLWDGLVVVAEALTAAAVLVNYNNLWWSYGIIRGQRGVRLLSWSQDKVMGLLKGDEFLREHGDKSAAKKSKRWLSEPMSDKQADLLGLPRVNQILFGGTMSKNRYTACCELTWKFNEKAIQSSIFAQT